MLQNLSDDQIALLGCLVALVGSGGLMALTFHLRRPNEKSESAEVTALPIRPVEKKDESAPLRRAA